MNQLINKAKFPKNLLQVIHQKLSCAKKLFVFDFDETIIQNNSDTFIYKTLKSQDIPKILKEKYRPGFWVDFMQEVFFYMNQNNISPEKMKSVLEKIPLTDGFEQLLKYLLLNKGVLFDTIIISNSNTLFIDWIIQKNGIGQVFDKIFTNPAKIENGIVHIGYHHSHNCLYCQANLCKKQVLLNYLKKHKYDNIYYAGDGINDFCPTTILKKMDIVFPRDNYDLSSKIIDFKKKNEYEPNVIFWKTGIDILKAIEQK